MSVDSPTSPGPAPSDAAVSTIVASGHSKPSAASRFLRPSYGLFLICLLVLFYLPRFVEDQVLLSALTLSFAFVMFAASWDVLSGYTGQVNFGHAAFIGTGAYTVALLSKYQPDLPGELALVGGTAVAAVLGLIIGIPCLRLKGPYLALATLSVASALVQLTFILKEETGAEDGISGIKDTSDANVLSAIGTNLSELVLGPLTFASKNGLGKQVYVEYFVLLLFAVVVLAGLLLFGYGKQGLVLRSIQQNESAAEAAGVPVTRYKLGAFILSASVAGLAGGLLAQVRGSVALDLLAIDLSLLIIIIAAFGGVGSIIGPAIGAFVVVLLQNFYLDKVGFFVERPELKLAAFSALLIAVLLVQPKGVVPPLLQRFARKPAAKGAGDATADDDERPLVRSGAAGNEK